MRVWLETVTPGQKGQTRGTALERVVDVREEVKQESRFFLMTSDTMYWLLRMWMHIFLLNMHLFNIYQFIFD